MIKLFRLYIRFFVAFAVILFLESCAAQSSPGGGPKDITGPAVISTYPENSAISVSGDTEIIVEFDEYISWKSIANQVSTSPVNLKFHAESRANRLLINFEESLPENKTIRITLGTEIKDMRKNGLESPFTFAFSTGEFLDSAIVKGKLFSPTGKPTVVKMQEFVDDSLICEYILPQNTREFYQFTNIHSGRYFLTASFAPEKSVDFLATVVLDDSSKKNLDIFMATSAKTQQPPSQPFQLLQILPEDSTTFSPHEKIKFVCAGNWNEFPKDSVSIFSDSIVVDGLWKNHGNQWVFGTKMWKTGSEISVQFDTLIQRYFVLPDDSLGGLSGTIETEDYSGWIVKVLANQTLKTIAQMPVNSNGTWQVEKLAPQTVQIFAFCDQNGNLKYDSGNEQTLTSHEPFIMHTENVEIRARWRKDGIVLK